MTALLQAAGYEVNAHDSARTFLAAVAPNASGCAVIDARIKGMSGLRLLEEMRERSIAIPVILITAHADVAIVVEAMKRGAVDFLEKPFDNKALLASIRQALVHKKDDQTRKEKSRAVQARLASLTKRENEVLTALLKGQSNKVIAFELGISVRTVEVHRANLMTKMGARGLLGLLRLALTGSQDAQDAPDPIDVPRGNAIAPRE